MPKILVVDDHDENRWVLSKLLSRSGYSVVEAPDGASALEQMRTEHPDLALVDLLMPVMGGFEFVYQLRQEAGPHAWTPVVFITAVYLPSEVASLAEACGVSHVLSRPAPFEEILRVLEEALRTRVKEGVVPPEREFSLELLRMLSSKVSQSIWSVIPALATLADPSGVHEAPASPGGDDCGPTDAG